MHLNMNFIHDLSNYTNDRHCEGDIIATTWRFNELKLVMLEAKFIASNVNGQQFNAFLGTRSLNVDLLFPEF